MATPDYSLLQGITDPKARATLRKIVEKIAAMETGVQDTQAQLAALPSGVTTAMVTQLMNARLASLGLLNAPIATPVIGTPPSATPAPLPPLPGPIPGGVVPGTPPTRAQVCGVNLSFQGLTVNTAQFGSLPWFEAALSSFNEADRAIIYAAKHAAGDTHAVVDISWNYAESGQPYGINDALGVHNIVPPRDLTGDLVTFKALVAEVIANGFIPVIFLAGDSEGAGPGYNDPVGWTYGYDWLTAHLPGILGALASGPDGIDLTPWCLFVPGFDSVFYGWEPSNVKFAAFGALFRALLPNGYLGILHQMGKIPIGGGQADYAPGGAMVNWDVLLSQFGRIGDAASRNALKSANPVDYVGNDIWQVATRTLGPAYVWPSDEPANADSHPAPWYLVSGNPRGPYFVCAFEWVGLYDFIRGNESAEAVSQDRAYLKSLGYTYTG